MSKNDPLQKIDAELSVMLNQELEDLGQLEKERENLAKQLQLSSNSMNEKHNFQKIYQELSSVLEQRIQNLNESILQFDKLSRQILNAELETKKNNALYETLKEELQSKTQAVSLTQQKLAKQKGENKQIQEDHSLLHAELSMENESIDRYRDTAQQLTERLGILEKESKELRLENAKLQSKLKHLEDNIEGMKRLKEEHMLSIMHRTEHLQKISSGTE